MTLGFLKKLSFFQIFLTAGVLMILLCFVSFVFFDSGLSYDGSFKSLLIIYYEDFSFYEVSRQSFQFLQQLPVWVFLHGTDSNSLSSSIKLFSFGLIWIHIPSLLVCYLMTHRKISFFFPLFAFFTGPLTAFSASISVALSLCSYLWAVCFIIYYSDLSLRSHKTLLTLSFLPLFQSHEMMCYMSLFLMGLCFLKLKKEKDKINRHLILTCIGFLGFLFAYHTFDLIFLEEIIARKTNKSLFLEALFKFNFLVQNSKLNIFVLISILLKVCLLIELFIKKNKSYCFLGLFLLALFLQFIFSVSLSPNSLFSYHTRTYPPVISLPFSLFVWLIYEEKLKNWKPSNLFLIICFFGFLSLTFYRIQSNFEFYNHRKSVSKYLSNCQGVLNYSKYEVYYNNNKDTDWNILSKSLLYPKKRNINAIIKNDLCHNELPERKNLNQKQIKEACDNMNLGFPKKLTEPDFKLETRFFNFKPIYEAYKKGISNCYK